MIVFRNKAFGEGIWGLVFSVGKGFEGFWVGYSVCVCMWVCVSVCVRRVLGVLGVGRFFLRNFF